ncbi:aminodeoxychorismate synthase component I [Ornithinimicrobium pratense]|uniref:aminodeoxychorismate synthase n=1 Tax=Ornithinimicrobium pratense TaxID=2593973 RepID=A0A5J6V8Z9_9MICO|nr:aminodeoxychorismate synthase component I [Ornithinimicrobium pratense]QFG69601.1 aminodeoxychorismate synthase component I [Ornithinimicrobium pratense]
MSGEVLLVDNVDSFTYNIADLLHRVLGRPPVVWRHDREVDEAELRAFAAIVVGPGPGRPQVSADMGLSELALRQRDVPVLGVCLGHQGLAHLAGERVGQMAVPRHGIVSAVEHEGTGIFAGVPSPLSVVRYHSLDVAEPLVSRLQATARATDDGSVMGLADPDRPVWSVQFHPESVLSDHGETIVANFLRLAGVRPPHRPVAGAGEAADTGPVAVGDALAAPAPWPEGVAATVGVCRWPGPVDVWALQEELLSGAATSAWLDASDGSGWSVLVDSRGPLSYELEHRVGEGPPLLDRMDQLLGRWHLDEAERERVARLGLPFTWRPGLVGWWGYELKAETGGSAAHRSPWPDAWLIFADRGVVVDHATGAVYAVWLETPDVAAAQREWAEGVGQVVASARPGAAHADGSRAAHAGPDPRPLQAASSCPEGGEGRPWQAVRREGEAAYLELVREAQEQIARGETYEVCLTTAYTVRGSGVGEAELYRAIREVSPVPHGAWLRAPGVSVLSGSPERFVSVRDGVVEARPIKGTRPRGATHEEDARLVEDLHSAQKDRAENLMIVDLLRNDLHRVCRSGSVEVPQIFAVETYATVHQLVSTVRGRLADGMGPTDVLRACFPGGSMTGAPKVRTMEILDALEGAARGIYSGAIGWVGLDGTMDTSIVIRTATWADGEVAFGVGGAVTALSDPGEEYAETVTKAQSVLRALDLALTDRALDDQTVAERMPMGSGLAPAAEGSVSRAGPGRPR